MRCPKCGSTNVELASDNKTRYCRDCRHMFKSRRHRAKKVRK